MKSGPPHEREWEMNGVAESGFTVRTPEGGLTIFESAEFRETLLALHEVDDWVDQVRRAAVSVPSDIAEGVARQAPKEFAKFVHVAQEVLGELELLLDLARRSNEVNARDWEILEEMTGSVTRMITRHILRPKPPHPQS